MQELLEAIRAACSPGTWSRGVELARAGSVMGEANEGDEIVLRVSLQGGMNSMQVVLFPDDADWTCDCKFREDACPHVCAAVIALKRARDDGLDLPGEDAKNAPGRVGCVAPGKLRAHHLLMESSKDKDVRKIKRIELISVSMKR